MRLRLPPPASPPDPFLVRAVLIALATVIVLACSQTPVRAGPSAADARTPAAATEAARSARSAAPRWSWPGLHSLGRRFEAPADRYGPGHRGLDLLATAGTPVLAVEAGVVTHAGPVAGRGTVTLRHADGLESTYEPVEPSVAEGDDVDRGQELGDLSTGTHCPGASCLHLGARRGENYADPLPLLLGGRLSLLPLTD